ncbi:MAG: type II secretion system protein [Phycisphaerales bacterium]|nr:type II secretion system protein [Phycisphaerales bacterium]
MATGPLGHFWFRRSGFTLIEMLVAFSIMVVMVVIIDRVFVQAGNAIRAGIGTSEITNNYRSIADQIDRDAQAMIDPSSGGILVVIHHVLGDTNINDGNLEGDVNNDGMIGPGETSTEGVPMWHPQWGTTQRFVRSDQLLFIANSASWQPLTGKFLSGSDETFSNDRYASTARVWYGHVQQTIVMVPHLRPMTLERHRWLVMAAIPIDWAIDWCSVVKPCFSQIQRVMPGKTWFPKLARSGQVPIFLQPDKRIQRSGHGQEPVTSLQVHKLLSQESMAPATITWEWACCMILHTEPTP